MRALRTALMRDVRCTKRSKCGHILLGWFSVLWGTYTDVFHILLNEAVIVGVGVVVVVNSSGPTCVGVVVVVVNSSGPTCVGVVVVVVNSSGPTCVGVVVVVNSSGPTCVGVVTIFTKPFFYERFLDWHNTRLNGLTHIFLDLWEDRY